MIKVVSFKICPFVQRVTAALEVKKIPYKIEYISLKNKPEWFTDISPNGQVPLLLTKKGTVLFESDAIIEYIDDFYQPLEQNLSPEQKALDRAWCHQASKHYLTQCSAMRSIDQKSLNERSEKLERAFIKVEKQLDSGPYFKGQTLSKIDIAWLPLLHRSAIIEKHTDHDFLAKFPKVKKWQCALLKTGLAEKSVAKDFLELFTGFYLSTSTYLGKDINDKGTFGNFCSTIKDC